MRSPSADSMIPDDLEACVELMRGGSKTFFAASRLLPRRVRAPAIALYAFCRVADDLVDQGGEPAASLAILSRRLDAIYAGRPEACVEDRALSLVVREEGLPRPLLDALLDGFLWDSEGRTYETVEEVHAYGARVAGSVGAMMAWLMGVREPGTLARACELGVAMQFTNIARDVGEDARNGRLYLPRRWLREAGLHDPDAWLRRPAFTPAIQRTVSRLLDEADRLYARANLGVRALPGDCRAAILAASVIYAEIGHQLRREGCDSISRRTVVSGGRKLALLAYAKWRSALPRFAGTTSTEDLAAIRYLVGFCEQTVMAGVPGSRAPRRALGGRVVWMIDLFERLDSQRRERRVEFSTDAGSMR